MRKPIYASKEHETILDAYITMNKEFVRDISNDTRWKGYLDVLDIIIEYHNNYGNNIRKDTNNWYDWIMILPVNISIMTNGYFAGIETKRNGNTIRSYKIILNEMLQDLVDKMEKLERIYD
tara:strand:- start:394 stop:756 length:363 start_codon:yes stop_codon:yes gene_type:complete